MILSRRAALAGAAATFVLAGQARAESAFGDGAGVFIKDLADRAIGVLNDRSMPVQRRVDSFRALFLEGFDVPTIAQFVMGRAWARATDEQRQTYLRVFEEVTLLTWALRFNEYAGETLKLDKTRVEGGRVAFVDSQVVRPGRDPVKVQWRIERPRGAYKILDIVVEGSSMAVAQRADYSAVLQQGNGKVDALIAALNTKLDQLNQKAQALAQN
ncbi:MAG: ABC transporter substrate-binding protein [Alphaproteobacteria bacterium]|nr:ABC transporter substrate-binding protein [Alphaproteobacteria bacterium]